MANARTSRTNEDTNPFNFNYMKGGETAFFTMAHINGVMLKSLVRYNLEALKFLEHRLEKDVAVAQKICNCRNFSELQEATDDFYREAFDEYAQEATKLANLGAELASKASREVQMEVSDAAEKAN